jgi:hypothetical protein
MSQLESNEMRELHTLFKDRVRLTRVQPDLAIKMGGIEVYEPPPGDFSSQLFNTINHYSQNDEFLALYIAICLVVWNLLLDEWIKSNWEKHFPHERNKKNLALLLHDLHDKNPDDRAITRLWLAVTDDARQLRAAMVGFVTAIDHRETLFDWLKAYKGLHDVLHKLPDTKRFLRDDLDDLAQAVGAILDRPDSQELAQAAIEQLALKKTPRSLNTYREQLETFVKSASGHVQKIRDPAPHQGWVQKLKTTASALRFGKPAMMHALAE